jgi:hypothetical protein
MMRMERELRCGSQRDKWLLARFVVLGKLLVRCGSRQPPLGLRYVRRRNRSLGSGRDSTETDRWLVCLEADLKKSQLHGLMLDGRSIPDISIVHARLPASSHLHALAAAMLEQSEETLLGTPEIGSAFPIEQANLIMSNGPPVETNDEPKPRYPRPPKFEDKYQEREYLKGRLALAFRIFGKLGFEEGVVGHITLRDPVWPDHFWINPFGTAFALITSSSLLVSLAQTDHGVIERHFRPMLTDF